MSDQIATFVRRVFPGRTRRATGPIGTMVGETVQLLRQYSIDAGLEGVLEAVRTAGNPKAALEAARAGLQERADAVDLAAEQVDLLRDRLDYFAGILAFTKEAWPERRKELNAELAADGIRGLATWLDDWFGAASRARTDALGRLHDLRNLPKGAAELVERCRTAARGLDSASWYVAHGMVEAGAAGLRIGDRTVPSDKVRGELRLLLGRLLLREIEQESDERRRARLLDEAHHVLAANGDAPSAAVEALSARCARLAQNDNDDQAFNLLQRAAADAPADLDVAVALIENARSDRRYDAGLDAARVAIDALPVLSEAKLELDRLVNDAPAELWAAVAERALEENELELQKEAADRAERLAPWDAYVLHALILEQIAEGSAKRAEPISQQVSALVDAGAQRVFAGQLETAVGHFERALQLQPGHREACIRLADCLVTLAAAEPLASARPQLKRALELLDSGREEMPQYTWSYQTEAQAYQQLAEAASDERRLDGWKALLAACRAVVHDMQSATRWGDLTIAAATLSLYALTIAAARHAVELARNDAERARARAHLVRSLTNAGEIDEALEALGSDDASWSRAVRAHLVARRGDAEEALQLLRETDLDPSWSWAHLNYATVLVLTGNYDEAMHEAEVTRSAWEQRLDEIQGLWTVSWTAVMLGDYGAAEDRADDLEEFVEEGEAHMLRAMAWLIQGEKRGVGELIAYVGQTRTSLALEPYLLALVRALALHRGTDLPPLEGVREAVVARQAQLEGLADPIVELRNAVVPAKEEGVVEIAEAMCSALVYVARGEPAAGKHAIERALAKHPDDRELTVLGTMISSQESSDRIPASADGRGSPELVEPLPSSPERPLQAVMPPSWFAEYHDPLNEHPFFLRYLPELRAKADVPGANVTTDEELEPDGYAIVVSGEQVEKGRISRDYFYATPEALKLLDVELGSTAEKDDATGLMRIPRSSVTDADRLVPLFSIVAEEYVARRLADLAAAHADRLAAIAR